MPGQSWIPEVHLKPLAAFLFHLKPDHPPEIRDRPAASLESWATAGFLQVLLTAMRATFLLDRDFRRNLDGFEARYLFRTQDGSMKVHAVFTHGGMTIGTGDIDGANITIIFRDEGTLFRFLLSPKPDILGAMLRQDVVLHGNLNYLYKFAYLAKRLQIMALGHA